jgi:uncharacterized protein with von Willebrand factor type A (vWA) domain
VPPAPDGVGTPDLAGVCARFTERLRTAGVPVTGERAGRWAAAVGLAGPSTRRELYWLGRVTLLSSPAQTGVYDREFAAVFGGGAPAPEDPAAWRGPHPPAAAPPVAAPFRPSPSEAGPGAGAPLPAPGRDGGTEGDAGREVVVAAASAEERLRHRDLATLDSDELGLLRALAGRLANAPPPRRSRRWQRTRHGAAMDVRATLRSLHRTGGEPLRPTWRRRRVRTRRLVLISDVSGSMEAYSRAYLTLLAAAAAMGGARAEAFVFATRLTRVTRELREAGPAAALARAARAAPDWSGGTRIGSALKTFNDDFGRRGVARGAVVVIISDGWDRGQPDLVAREMERLGRLAWRVIWVNPRKARPGFAPLTGGMAAALPHVDRFLSGHSLEAFDEVLAAIGEPGRGSPDPESTVTRGSHRRSAPFEGR